MATKNPVKETRVRELLADMIEADSELYDRITSTPKFAYLFNQLAKLAETGDDWYESENE